MTAPVATRGEGLVTRCCPGCGSARARAEAASRPPAEEARWEELQQCWAGFFQRKVFFTFARCQDCGLLYSPRYFSEAQLGRLYASMADNTAGLGAERMNRTQAGYVAGLSEAAEGDFLELGPDIGLFTAAYAGRFDTSCRRRYWLYEPNVAVHDELRRRLRGHALEIRTQLMGYDEIPDGSLGVVVMIHVLDHLSDPQRVLSDLVRKLRPGGRIHIVTHNEGSLLARGLRARWPAFCLQHPQLFRPATITRLLKSAGLEVESIRRTTNYFPVPYLLRHGLYALGIDWPALGRLPAWEMGLKLGNIMTSGRKPA